MKKLVFLFIILLIALGLGYFMHQGAGYILIAYRDYRIEMGLWPGLILIIILCLIVYALIRFIHHLLHVDDYWQNWKNRYQERKKINRFAQGLHYFEEGDLKKSENELEKAMGHRHLSMGASIHAVESAIYQNALHRVEQLKLKTKSASNLFMMKLKQTELLMLRGQWQQAYELLLELHQLKLNHPVVLELMMRCALQMQKWYELEELLPELKKNRVIDNKKLQHLKQLCLQGLFQIAVQENDETRVYEFWGKMDKSYRAQLENTVFYVKFLMQKKEFDLARILLLQQLSTQWNDTLVKLFVKCCKETTSNCLPQAEEWLKEHPNDPQLLYCLGFLSSKEKLWGKARDYLEQSLRLKPMVQTRILLSTIYDKLGEPDKVRDIFNVLIKQL